MEIPWGVAIRLFKPQLLLLLTKEQGMSPKEARDYLSQHVSKHSELLETEMGKLAEKHFKDYTDARR